MEEVHYIFENQIFWKKYTFIEKIHEHPLIRIKVLFQFLNDLGSFLDEEFSPSPLKSVHRILMNSLYYNFPYRWLGMWRTSRACVGSSWTAWAPSPLSLSIWKAKKTKDSLGFGAYGPKPKGIFWFFLPFRCLALRFPTDCKVSVSGSWVVRHT